MFTFESHMLHLGVASNQPLPNDAYEPSFQQSVSPLPSLPVIPVETLNQSLPDIALPSVQPSSQQSITALSCPNSSEGIESNQQAFYAIIRSSQTPNSGTDQGFLMILGGIEVT